MKPNNRRIHLAGLWTFTGAVIAAIIGALISGSYQMFTYKKQQYDHIDNQSIQESIILACESVARASDSWDTSDFPNHFTGAALEKSKSQISKLCATGFHFKCTLDKIEDWNIKVTNNHAVASVTEKWSYTHPSGRTISPDKAHNTYTLDREADNSWIITSIDSTPVTITK